MNVTLDGSTLSTMEVELVASGRASVDISESSMLKVEQSRNVVERVLNDNEIIYGINTGFGSLSQSIIPPEDLKELQLNLIRSHACGLGNPMSKYDTRALMAIRANSLAKGYSGISPGVLRQLVLYLNEDVIPVIPQIGSLGASGDLAPLSHMALSLIGEGEVWKDNLAIPTQQMLLEKGLISIDLGAKDGLSLINGTSQMCAILNRVERMLDRILPMADLVACASLESKNGLIDPFDPRVHEVRPHLGQVIVGKRIHAILSNSPIINSKIGKKVQDPYSFRCIPQVHGAVLDKFHALTSVLDIELNSATDNPLIFPEPRSPGRHEIISQGNFHGEILAVTADAMSLVLFELASISERRIDHILDSSRSGLSPFLARKPGLESGLMIVQYVAAASLGEMHGGILPRSGFSVPTSANQEDHVSMGSTAAWNLLGMCEHLAHVLACEALVACEALEYSDLEPSNHVLSFKNCIRTISAPLLEDRSTSEELKKIAERFTDGTWLARIEAECGRLIRN